MDQQAILKHLRDAKAAHLGWVKRANALIEGTPVDKEKIPVKHTDCIFGKWYYSEGRKLSGLSSYRAIEEPHNQLHAIYKEIFDLLFEQKQGNFISRLFGGARKENARREQARQRYRDLQNQSDIIMQQLLKLENEVKALGKRT